MDGPAAPSPGRSSPRSERREDTHIPRRSSRSPSGLEGQGMDHGNGNVGNTARLSGERAQLESIVSPSTWGLSTG